MNLDTYGGAVMPRRTQTEIIEQLKAELKETNDKLKAAEEKNKKYEALLNTHNERGAGRKRKFTDSEIATIMMYRIQGMTYQSIADMFNCSVGLIHNLTKEEEQKSKGK